MVLYAFGSNGAGQLGLQHKDDCSTPQEVILPSDALSSTTVIKSIAGGGSHTLLLLDNGVCFVAGSNAQGQAPCPETTVPSEAENEIGNGFRPISPNLNFKACAALWEASILVTVDDKVFVIGNGPKGELGLGPNFTYASTLQRIEGFPPTGTEIKRIASGVAHTVVLLSNGDAWGWGNGRKGQLGEPTEIVNSPRRINIPRCDADTAEVACGREFSYFASIDVPERHIVLGSDKWNVVTEAPKTLRPITPTPRKDIIRSVGACWSSVVVLLNRGDVEAWGRSDKGQLPLAKQSPLIEKIAAGSEHCIGLTADQEVVCCGWGEHGNCGSETDEDGNVVGWVKIPFEVPMGSELVGVGAGCATSFFWTHRQV